MMENRPSQRAMEKIMKGEVAKKSRTYFIFVNIALWFFGALSVLAGALVVSIVIFTVANSDMDLHREIYGYALPRITFIAIGIWLLLTGLFAILCDIAVRNTTRGYTYPLWVIIVGNILLGVVFGVLFYKVGVSYSVDYLLGAYIPHYYNVDKRSAMLFNMPEKGIITGKIVTAKPTYVIMLTPENRLLAVLTTNIDAQKLLNLQKNERVVFLGKPSEDGIFVACDVHMQHLNGVRQIIQEELQEALEERELEEQDQELHLLERMHIISAQALHFCDEQVHWRIAP